MVILIKTVQLLLSLSILVIIHEFGHYAFARLFKTRVEKFYLFFNPWFSLFKYKKGDTEYGIGWIPLGGYVKISGMIDESMDKEQMKQPPQPWEFRSKKAWQRLLIMIGGVLMNFVLAALIYIGILFTWGNTYLPTENMKYGITADILAQEIGFRNGDKLVSVNGKTYESFQENLVEILLSKERNVQVERDGNPITISINNSQIGKVLANKQLFIDVRQEFIVDTVVPDRGAYKAGIQKGDKLIALNDSSMICYDQYLTYFKTHKNSSAIITVKRSGTMVLLPVQIDSSGLIGVGNVPYAGLELKHENYSLFSSIPAGISKGMKEVKNYLRQFKLIFNPEIKGHEKIGSFIAIGNMFAPVWDWKSFWGLTAFLSIILGVINIFPIPALDGGHVMFVLYEIISGRKPSDKFLEYAQIVGFVILLALIIFALRNDVINYIL
jgi:regulator of sigma E protease